MNIGVNFPRHREWSSTTRRVPDAVVERVIRSVVADVERYWRQTVPVRTGRLRRSANSRARGSSGTARLGAPYASFVAARINLHAKTLGVVNSRSVRRRAELAARKAIDRLERTR